MKITKIHIWLPMSALLVFAACGDSGYSSSRNPSSPSPMAKATCVANNDLNNDGTIDQIHTQKFDGEGRISSSEDDPDADGNANVVISYSYNGDNVTLSIDNNNDGQPEVVTTQSIYSNSTSTEIDTSTTDSSTVTTQQNGNTSTTDVDLDSNGTIDVHSVLTCSGPNL